MNIEFNILDWWDSLDRIWKDIFENNIFRNTLIIKIKKELNKELTKEEESLFKLKKDFKKNNSQLKILAINKLLEIREITIGRSYKFELIELHPLLHFKKLEKINFINCDIKAFTSLDELKFLKVIDFSKAQLKEDILNEFRKNKTVEILT